MELISAHLENQFGPPNNKDVKETDASLEWNVNGIRLSLNYFEQHAYKLHFEISRFQLNGEEK